MEIGLVGLGKMGGNMARRLLAAGHAVVAYAPSARAVEVARVWGAIGVDSLADVVRHLSPPRAVWLMVPSGSPTENTVDQLAELLSVDDVVIDGGNSNYKDSMRRAASLKEKGIHLLDAGTSGGVWGLQEGYCLMVGGDEAAFRRVEAVLQSLAPAPDRGYAYVGPSGAGHFVKMVHNGIEYGLMQAYAEGFELLQAKGEFAFDLPAIAEMWRHGSVIRSWLLDLAEAALEGDPKLTAVQPYVEDSGEGRWCAHEAIDLAVAAPIITQALQVRFASRDEERFGDRLLAALRNQFGGHGVKKA
jgi:6-phosphogluconate dehydrogenase